MKTLIIFITLILFSATSAYSKEAADCKNLKKLSLKAAMCKTKAAGRSIKNKWSKKRELKKKSKSLKFFQTQYKYIFIIWIYPSLAF